MTGFTVTTLCIFFLCAVVNLTHAQEAVPEQAGEIHAEEDAADSGLDADRIPDTLMFSIDDLNEIQSRIAGSGASSESDDSAIEEASLYLSTILYYGREDWTAWINGVPIGPGENFQSFTVTDIGPAYVELLVPLSAQGMQPVRLSPNQTFVTDTGTIIEGPWER